jgi:hypothetical protein
MNTELKPPTTQAEAIHLLDIVFEESKDGVPKSTAYMQLKELIRLLLPE